MSDGNDRKRHVATVTKGVVKSSVDGASKMKPVKSTGPNKGKK